MSMTSFSAVNEGGNSPSELTLGFLGTFTGTSLMPTLAARSSSTAFNLLALHSPLHSSETFPSSKSWSSFCFRSLLNACSLISWYVHNWGWALHDIQGLWSFCSALLKSGALLFSEDRQTFSFVCGVVVYLRGKQIIHGSWRAKKRGREREISMSNQLGSNLLCSRLLVNRARGRWGRGSCWSFWAASGFSYFTSRGRP